MSKLDEAIRWAAELHAGQLRDGDAPLPYIVHPIEVLSNLRYVGQVTDPDMLVAAVLHDTLEETDAEPDEIESRFGARVRTLVIDLTRHEPSASEAEGLSPKELWKLRADMLLDEIAKMPGDAQAIKLADRFSNLREAKRTKKGDKLDRYVWQTLRILEIVPKPVNRGLWEAISGELKSL